MVPTGWGRVAPLRLSSFARLGLWGFAPRSGFPFQQRELADARPSALPAAETAYAVDLAGLVLELRCAECRNGPRP